jgi:sugar phosphate isomerase/epimerase
MTIKLLISTMQIKYICPYWGWNFSPVKTGKGNAAIEFIDQVVAAGYDGIEIDTPANKEFEKELLSAIGEIRKQKDFIFIAQQWLSPARESFEEYRMRYAKRLEHLAALKPDFINSHTGKDYFSFEQNAELLECAFELSVKTGIRILHETHRGRFSFHLPRTLTYLKKFPDLELVADFSHWCTVSESLLEDQQEILDQIIPHCTHIHARIGYEHSPQVNDFRAPEWKQHVERFVGWWNKILDRHKNKKELTICPEFGPVSYMPTEPFTRKPLADQWEENIAMMNMLKEIF